MTSRFRGALARILLLSALSAPAAAQRARNVPEATVFIQVVGTAKIEVEGAMSESERGVELGTGSGFIFTPYGHVLTNHHVIETTTIADRFGSRDVELELSVDRIEVVLPGAGGARYEASIEVIDPALDLAVLSIVGGEMPYLAFGDSDAAEQGDVVQVYGFPFGKSVEVGRATAQAVVPQVTVTQGSMSATRTDDSGNPAYLQTSARVNPGNSGGPMVDADGYVLGVVRLKLRDADGIGFAIPANTAKEFLTQNGYDQLIPVTPLRLGGEQSFDGKGLSVNLPDVLEDVSPTRLRVFSDPGQSLASVHFRSDRVSTAWSLQQLEQALVSGGTFGTFRASGELTSRPMSDGSAILGRARGRDTLSGTETWMEYALFAAGDEKVVIRFEAAPDEIAYNRSLLLTAFDSVRIEGLLTAPIGAVLPPDALGLRSRALPTPSAPAVSIPDGWYEEVSAPFPCRGLPSLASALAVSPPEDFTVSLRVGWWPATLDPAASAEACSERRGSLGNGSYFYTVDWLGERYVVEGLFTERTGTLQLELVTPEAKHGFVRDAARAWIESNR